MYVDLTLWNERSDAQNCGLKSGSHIAFVGPPYQARGDVAVVEKITGFEHLISFIKFEDPELCQILIQVRESGRHKIGAARRQEEIKSFHQSLARLLKTTMLKPQQAKG